MITLWIVLHSLVTMIVAINQILIAIDLMDLVGDDDDI
jgi:hypothetical protein